MLTSSTSPLRRTRHAIYELKYHFVWIPKYRKKVLNREIKEKLKEIFFQIAEEYDCEIIEQRVMSDHVHLFLSAPPKYSPSRLVNIIKSISRNEIFREFPGFARRCWNKKLWADGYFVRAVGDKVTADEIQKYVRYQTKEKQGIQLELFPERTAK